MLLVHQKYQPKVHILSKEQGSVLSASWQCQNSSSFTAGRGRLIWVDRGPKPPVKLAFGLDTLVPIGTTVVLILAADVLLPLGIYDMRIEMEDTTPGFSGGIIAVHSFALTVVQPSPKLGPVGDPGINDRILVSRI